MCAYYDGTKLLSLTDLDYSPAEKFISGSILRYENDLVEDLHALNNIASELKRGGYFGWE